MDRFQEPFKNRIRNSPHQLADLLRVQMRTAIFLRSTRDRLIHDGESVAHGAVSSLGEQRQCGVFREMSSAVAMVAKLGKDVVKRTA